MIICMLLESSGCRARLSSGRLCFRARRGQSPLGGVPEKAVYSEHVIKRVANNGILAENKGREEGFGSALKCMPLAGVAEHEVVWVPYDWVNNIWFLTSWFQLESWILKNRVGAREMTQWPRILTSESWDQNTYPITITHITSQSPHKHR